MFAFALTAATGLVAYHFIDNAVAALVPGIHTDDLVGGVIGREELEGTALDKVSPDLDDFMHGDQPEADVQVAVGSGHRTLAVKRVRYQDGAVLTFDDITELVSAQRTSAWGDVARRIAHEILEHNKGAADLVLLQRARLLHGGGRLGRPGRLALPAGRLRHHAACLRRPVPAGHCGGADLSTARCARSR